MERVTGRYYLIIALLVVAGAISYTLRYVSVQPEHQSDFSVIPLEKDGWEGRELPLADWTLDVLKATDNTSRQYIAGDELFTSLFIGYFKDQKYGSQIHSPRHCLPGGGWGILSLEPIELDIDGERLSVNRVLIGDDRQRQIVYYWYRTRSGELTNEFALKFDLVKNSLFLQPTDAAMIRLMTFVNRGEEEEGDRILKDFLRSFLPSIEKSLPFERT